MFPTLLFSGRDCVCRIGVDSSNNVRKNFPVKPTGARDVFVGRFKIMNSTSFIAIYRAIQIICFIWVSFGSLYFLSNWSFSSKLSNLHVKVIHIILFWMSVGSTVISPIKSDHS